MSRFDEHIVSVDPDLIDADGLIGRRVACLAAVKVERSAVGGAHDAPVLDVSTVRKRNLCV